MARLNGICSYNSFFASVWHTSLAFLQVGAVMDGSIRGKRLEHQWSQTMDAVARGPDFKTSIEGVGRNVHVVLYVNSPRLHRPPMGEVDFADPQIPTVQAHETECLTTKTQGSGGQDGMASTPAEKYQLAAGKVARIRFNGGTTVIDWGVRFKATLMGGLSSPIQRIAGKKSKKINEDNQSCF